MKVLKHLFDVNRKWATKIKESNPDFFIELSNQQIPEYLWIGCSDSRVPATQLVKLVIHGWIYDIKTGLLKDLDACITNRSEISKIHQID